MLRCCANDALDQRPRNTLLVLWGEWESGSLLPSLRNTHLGIYPRKAPIFTLAFPLQDNKTPSRGWLLQTLLIPSRVLLLEFKVPKKGVGGLKSVFTLREQCILLKYSPLSVRGFSIKRLPGGRHVFFHACC